MNAPKLISLNPGHFAKAAEELTFVQDIYHKKSSTQIKLPVISS